MGYPYIIIVFVGTPFKVVVAVDVALAGEVSPDGLLLPLLMLTLFPFLDPTIPPPVPLLVLALLPGSSFFFFLLRIILDADRVSDPADCEFGSVLIDGDDVGRRPAGGEGTNGDNKIGDGLGCDSCGGLFLLSTLLFIVPLLVVLRLLLMIAVADVADDDDDVPAVHATGAGPSATALSSTLTNTPVPVLRFLRLVLIVGDAVSDIGDAGADAADAAAVLASDRRDIGRTC